MQPDQVIVKKKKRTCRIVDFAFPVDQRVKIKESKKSEKYVDLAKELKRTMEHEGDGDINSNPCTWNNTQRIVKETGWLGSEWKCGDRPEYRIIKIGQNTKKSPKDLRRLTVS